MPDATDRHAVWVALSELWLDTTLQDDDLEAVVVILRESPFDLEAIDEIHWREVAPVLYGNLLSVAGEWAGFDPDALIALCQGQRDRKDRWTARLLSAALRRAGNAAYDDVRIRLKGTAVLEGGSK